MSHIKRISIPATRDPFINAPLLRLTPDPQSGQERFWISSWNRAMGGMGLVVDENGQCRKYMCNAAFPGFYSAVQVDDNTLWLCGSLAQFIRLNLSDGSFDAFETGERQALVFEGMPYDRDTGKLFAFAFHSNKARAVIFDTTHCKRVTAFDLPGDVHYMRASAPMNDGRWAVFGQLPGIHMLTWNPMDDSVEETVLKEETDMEHRGCGIGSIMRIVHDESGRIYLPGQGWYDTTARAFLDLDSQPGTEMTWFAQKDSDEIVGIATDDATSKVGIWNRKTGHVREICVLADTLEHNVALSSRGKLINVSMYGQFKRIDLTNGEVECECELPIVQRNTADTLALLPDGKLLGTPFISQRFWLADLDTSDEQDCGRAASGGGQIMHTCLHDSIAYMMSYASGSMSAFDSREPGLFPNNPRCVAQPPTAMRPIAYTVADGKIYYTSNRPYGLLGSTLTCYNPKDDKATYSQTPTGDRAMLSLVYDQNSDQLLATLSRHADCHSAPPTASCDGIALLSPHTLQLIESVDLRDASIDSLRIVGQLDHETWLACYGFPYQTKALAIRTDPLSYEHLNITLPNAIFEILGTAKPGYFVMNLGENKTDTDLQIHLVEVTRDACYRIARLDDGKGPIGRMFVQNNDLLYVSGTDACVVYDVLPG